MLTEAEAIRAMRRHLEGRFPKICPNCQRRYASLQEYVQATQPIGETLSYDGELGDWNPAKPLGTVALANCPCGNTLSLTSHGMPVPQLMQLLEWARIETKRQGITLQVLLGQARNEIRRQALAEMEQQADSP